jgi:phage/plasmid-like protein (TIGR03299 family)
MAHNINTYIGRRSAWHELGTVTGKYQTTEELLADPGFRYHVFKEQLRDGYGRPVDAWATYRINHADQNDLRKAEFLGSVGEDYAVVQHAEGFKTIDALMQTADGAHYETAGVLGNGETVWALADLGLTVNVRGDQQDGYVLFSTGHDGSMSHSYRLTMTRVVCQNTLNVALSGKTKAKLTVRHTKNAMSKIHAMGETLQSISADMRSVEDKLKFLASRKVTKDSMVSILDRLFPKAKDDNGSDRDTTRRTNIVSKVLELYESNDNNAFPEQRGSAYNLLNAITNFTDHERIGDNGKRAVSSMFGSGDALKSNAFGAILSEAKDLPELVYVGATAAPAPVRQTVRAAQSVVAPNWTSVGTSVSNAVPNDGDWLTAAIRATESRPKQIA